MKYTIYEFKFGQILKRCYAQTIDKGFSNNPEFKAIGVARTKKEAENIIEELGGANNNNLKINKKVVDKY